MVEVVPVRALDDNYIWLVRIPGGEAPAAVIVDPGDAAPAIAALNDLGWTPAAVLVTHLHYDHVDGVRALLRRYAIPVYGPAGGRGAGVDRPVAGGERVALAADLALEVLALPGHTDDHVAYLGSGMLFCGDTLFGAGCGRLFGGSAAVLYASLQGLAALPDETLVYCAHEYTLENLQFALHVEPGNADLQERLAAAQRAHDLGRPTLPSTIGLEKRTNPFLRCHVPAVAAAARRFCGRPLAGPAAVFAVLRYWKDIA